MVKHNWAIHTVLISSNLPYEEAEKHAFNIIHKKRKGYLEGKHYRFTNINKKFFSKFRTKIINPEIDIIFGCYKPEHAHLEGGSIGSFFKKGFNKVKDAVKSVVSKVKENVGNILKPREGYNHKCLKNIKLYGDKKIVKIVVARTALSTVATVLGRVVTLGEMEKIMEKEGIDRFFHIGIIATLEGGQLLLIEKNSVINIEPIDSIDPKSEIMDVDLKGKDLTLNELLDKGYALTTNKDEWWLYNAFSWNCQAFISLILRGVGIMTDKLKNFLYQELSKVLKQLPNASQKLIKGTTDLSATFDKLIGNGMLTENMKGGAKDEIDKKLLELEKKKKLLLDKINVKPVVEPKEKKTRKMRPQKNYSKFEDMPVTLLRHIAMSNNKYLKIENIHQKKKTILISAIKEHLNLQNNKVYLNFSKAGEKFKQFKLLGSGDNSGDNSDSSDNSDNDEE